jgi:hypothetical protein
MARKRLGFPQSMYGRFGGEKNTFSFRKWKSKSSITDSFSAFEVLWLLKFQEKNPHRSLRVGFKAVWKS